MEDLYDLRSVPLFRSLPDDYLEPLVRATQRRRYEAGEVVFRQGDRVDNLYIVESGGVDVVHESPREELILASFVPGSFFGELAIFDDQPRNATARATERTELIAVPGEAILSLIDRHPLAARQLLAAVAQRLRGAVEHLSRLSIRNANDIAEEQWTLGDRVADGVARFGGSWPFLFLFAAFLVAWMGVNTHYLLKQPPDPFPYIFLNLMLSCLAAVQAPIIMMSQNRHAVKDRVAADLDFQVNIKAEHAVQQLHRKVDELRALLLQERGARSHAEISRPPGATGR